MEKRKCFRKKCGIEFTPTKPKQKYCSTKCRTYAYRESLIKDVVQQVKEKGKSEEPKVNLPVDTRPKNDPKENSAAFFMKYGVMTYAEIKKS